MTDSSDVKELNEYVARKIKQYLDEFRALKKQLEQGDKPQ